MTSPPTASSSPLTTAMMPRIARRAERIAPFYVMEVAKAASDIARSASDAAQPMIYLNIGEPDFTAPPLVQEAAARAIRDGRTQYTPALGLDALRERISGWYAERFGLDVPARPPATSKTRSAPSAAVTARARKSSRRVKWSTA